MHAVPSYQFECYKSHFNQIIFCLHLSQTPPLKQINISDESLTLTVTLCL